MSRSIVVLDVREILKAKGEPFQVIMEKVQSLGEDDVLELHATFEPVPLLKVLGKQGLKNTVKKEDEEHYIVQFYRTEEERPYWHIDNRGLEPPQPMIRTLQMLETVPQLDQGEWGIEIWNERVPAVLLPELEDRGFSYEIVSQEEDTVVVRIHR